MFPGVQLRHKREEEEGKRKDVERAEWAGRGKGSGREGLSGKEGLAVGKKS